MAAETFRLLICTPTHYLQGGVERILESLATHLPSRGFDVVFGLAKGVHFHNPAAFRRAFPAIRGVDIDGTHGTVHARRRALFEAIERVKPALVLNARIFDLYPLLATLKQQRSPIRFAVTIQALEEDYFVDLSRYASFVDLCVASGELIASEVRRRTSLPSERIKSIPGGVAPPRRMTLRQDGALRIGYVGRLEQVQKRILDMPRLVDALERRGVRFELEIVGDGSMIAELRRLVPRARFHGWVSTEELYERIYPELDVFVHFAEWEGVTIAPREAMAHGVVPVVSRFKGLEEEGQFIHGLNALTFPIGDMEAAAEGIVVLHRDRELFEKLSFAARSSQGGIRSEQGAIDAWAAAFREAIERPPRSGAVVPPAPRDSGFLTRIGVPDSIAELVRRFRPPPVGGRETSGHTRAARLVE
jgi:glycosyltransferase involved in cell wall biosynthesis